MMDTDPTPKTRPEEWRGLALAARTLVEGLYAGGHRSVRRGQGVEFHDHRAYSPGDELRHLDWKAYGRSDRLYLRQAHRHGDLSVMLTLDASASMAFAALEAGGAEHTADVPSKWDYARQVAAALAMIAVRRGDRVGMAILSNRVLTHIDAAGGWPTFTRITEAMEAAPAPRGAGQLDTAMAALAANLPRRSLVIHLGDLLDDPAHLGAAVAALRPGRHELATLQVLSGDELHPDPAKLRLRRLIDPETPASGSGAHSSDPASAYQARLRRHLDAVRSVCAAMGVDHELVNTAQPCAATLRRWLGRRALRRH